MDVSVLITVKNDVENSRRMLRSLYGVKGEFEVIVVDAYSDDGTFELFVDEGKNLRMTVERKKGNRAMGRNRCIELSTGRKLVFLDSDTEVPADWIQKLIKHSDKDIVAGKIIQKSDKKWGDLGRVPIYFKNQDVTFPSNNLMYDRSVLDNIGRFDEAFQTAEDIDLNVRAVEAGFNIEYVEELEIFHYPRMSYFSLLKQSYYDGVGRRILKRKHGLKSSLNLSNVKRHPIIEVSRLGMGMLGYTIGEFK